MPTIVQDFTNSIVITITLDSLANGSSVASSAINNSVTKYLSGNVQLKIRTGAGTSATGTVLAYILRSVDGGVTYDDMNTNSEILGVFNANVDATDYRFSLDTNTVGSLPDYWKLAVTNNSGAAFNAVAANFSVTMLAKSLLIV
jgi:hypothetical protein